ncbi:MAG: hypothetical protein KDC61_03870 [Saprospiraceae bacterium]|nr:hypothetical protein [Saprospiraceae bacterium]MCB0542536.1 hypothetical protein [Saprospiraceae bacterium]MCB0573686.1 hypothetical protein [Saprospiraceae bacterium]MCB9306383.1 hypothetical protein [Lewinellaceae bacterium]MCB9353679.1 hypothetical protein [Lewinellaceae bacterium]
MTDTRKQLEHLSEIRTLMERSARFLSLSGLSGVWAGACALIGVTLVYSYLEMSPFDAAGRFYSGKFFYYDRALSANKWGMNYEYAFILIAAGVFVAALAGGWFFTARKARKRGERIWDATSRRLLVALMIPLLTGGLLCLALLYRGYISLLAPCTLIFYGLALVNGGKFTLRDVEHLGRFEIALGLLGVYFPGYGLELWTLGFGFLHIVYGLWMYWKYDRKQ